MGKYKFTLAGLAVAFVVYFITIIFNVDLFETVIKFLDTFEKYEVDEFIIPRSLLSIFALIDLFRRQRLQKIEIEKTKIYKAMLSSTHHILNNFLNQMQLFRITAEDTPGFDPKVLSLYEVVIKDASTQIEALGGITSIDEASIHESVAPKLNSRPSIQPLFRDIHKPIDIHMSSL